MLKKIIPFLVFFALTLSSKAQYFVENKGQWPETVKYAAQIQGGMAFIEQDGIVFNFIGTLADSTETKNQLQDHEHFRANDKSIGHAFKLKFDSALLTSNSSEVEPKAGKFNYFLGKDPGSWARNCNGHNSLVFNNIVDGVDVELFTSNAQLKWNFTVKNPQALGKVTWHYEGIKSKIDKNNSIVLKSGLGKIEESLPFSFTLSDGKKVDVKYTQIGDSFGFELNGETSVGNKTLVIDPVLVFSTFSGSTADNFGYTATFDSEGFLYSGSSVFGIGYPATFGTYDDSFNGTARSTDIGISKFDTTGKFMVYSTYVGGLNDELPHSIIANSSGQLYILGSTSSRNYPVTPNAYQKDFVGGPATQVTGLGINYANGADIIVSLLSADGSSLLSSTYLGGSSNDGFISYINNEENPCIYNYADEVRGEIEFDLDGNIIIASSTYSTDFPFVLSAMHQTQNAGKTDGIVIKLKPNLNVLWATYVGGSGFDAAYSIQPDENNNYIIAGASASTDLTFTSNGHQPTNGGGRNDGYIGKLTPNGQDMYRGTYWGYINYDQVYFVDINQDNEILVYGQTEDEFGHFVTGNTKYIDNNSGLFVSKFDSTLTSLEWSTTVGTGTNAPNLSPTAFLTDVCDRIFISGWGGLTNNSSEYSGNKTGFTTGLPTTLNAFQKTTDGSDFYFAVFDINMDSLLYGSFFGGGVSREHVDGGTSRFDKKGVIYQAVCAGCGRNSDFPIAPTNAHSPTNNSNNCNLGVFKFDPQLKSLVADFKTDGPYCGQDIVKFTNLSQQFQTLLWDFGDGNTSTDSDPEHIYTTPGEYTVKLLAINFDACNIRDSAVQKIIILPDDIVSDIDTTLCLGDSITFDFSRVTDYNADFRFTPTNNHPDESFGIYTTKPTAPTQNINMDFVLGSCNRSIDIVIKTVDINPLTLTDTVLCNRGETISLTAEANGHGTQYVWSKFSDFSIILSTSQTDNSFSRTINSNEILYVRVQTPYCVITDSVNIDLIETILTLDKTAISCHPDSLITLYPSISSNSPNLSYQWQPSNLVLPNSTQPIVTASRLDTTYVLTVSTPNCSVKDSIDVKLSEVITDQLDAFIKDTLSPVGTYTLGINASNNTRPIVWSPDELFTSTAERNPTVFVIEDTYVYLSASEDGCIKEDSLLLKAGKVICGPPNIFAPTGFSPNTDGKNDLAKIRGQYITELQYEIFDQWGQKVFETYDQNIGWDGSFKGKPLNPAVFVYQLRATCLNRQVYSEKGNITLIK
jgi:gliding motility-associated-like protein